MSEVVWRPDEATVEHANATRLVRRAGVRDYAELLRRSQDEPSWFWPLAVEDMGLEFSKPWERVFDDSRGPEWTTWFVGGELSIADNCVHRWARREPARLAAVGLREDGSRREVTFAELSRDVTRLAERLASLGVGRGDRVAIFLPMSPDVAVASHAIAHLGAVQVPVFSGFAAPAVAQRLQASEAKVVITQRESSRRGKVVPMLAILEEALRESPSVEHVVLAPFELDDLPGELPALQVESEAPYLLTYTSGTTGKPKGVVHVQGGFLVSIAREVAYQADVHPGDVVHFATDMGWIMGPWTVVGVGALGGTIAFAEGAPDWPTPHRIWRIVEQERVTSLGVSPTLVCALLPHGAPDSDLSSLRTFVTTGEPWNPEPYRWLFEEVGGSRVPVINCSGGTEVGACFLSPTPVQPIKACSLGGPALGMAMDVVDETGASLVGTGEVGELVCRKPFPGMTRGFWRDPQKYVETYWSRIPGVWVHGDWASVDADGYWFLHGRSDDTMNIAGKRIGPAEYESAAVAHPAVREAAAIGVPHEVKGETAWIFAALLPDAQATEAEVAAHVAGVLGKAFKPDRVFFVDALPKTRSAKIVRRALRATALGQDPGDLSSLENPESLEAIAAAVA
ncbi:MAG TPA: AMP-binding protein [Gaiellaceae bacterium]|nr:AMP-binding protein [Gaiellaceae bacterium]